MRDAVSLSVLMIGVLVSDNGLANSLLHDGRGNLSGIVGVLASI